MARRFDNNPRRRSLCTPNDDFVGHIGRVRMRLEGLQSYGTLAALLANGCLRLYSCVNEKDAADCRYKAIAFNYFIGRLYDGRLYATALVLQNGLGTRLRRANFAILGRHGRLARNGPGSMFGEFDFL